MTTAFKTFCFSVFKLCLMILILLNHYPSQANGIADLIKFASPDGTMINDTAGGIINDQTGGFISGGSLILRGPKPKVLQPIQIQTPKFKYDACTGSADFAFGSLSYISGEEFLKMLKALPKSVGAYGLKMTLKTYCPQCEDIVMDLEEIARSINNMTIDQCAISQNIAQGMFSALAHEEQQKCLTRAGHSKANKDMYEATKSCKDNKDAYQEGKEEAEKNLLGDKFNLVWKALIGEKNNSRIDQDFFELIMSISGTLLAEKKDDSYVFETLPSLFDQNNIENLIGGATSTSIKLYSCNDRNFCMHPELKDKKLEALDTIVGKMRNIIEKYLIGNIRKDTSPLEMTSEELVLINFVSVPLIRLIENEIAAKGLDENFIISNSELLEVICYDLIINFISNLAKNVEDKVVALKMRENETKKIDSFLNGLHQTQRTFASFKHTAYQRAEMIIQIKERVTQQDAVFKQHFNRLWRTK